eukprot:scaffold13935_cov3324-Alexandrium_tamarense.AAC.2
MLFYLSCDVAPSRLHGRLVLDLSQLVWRATHETTSGGEFGWGGTSYEYKPGNRGLSILSVFRI